VRFSVWPNPERPWGEILDVVMGCDRAGWHGAYVADHFMPNDPDGHPLPGAVLESWALVAALAARVDRLRLGTLVSGNLYRHPAVVANAAVTVDHVSGGRFVLGLGAGWQVNEHAAYGIDLLDVPTRLDHLEEACEVITSLLRNPTTTFNGRHYQLTAAPCEPKPVRGSLPLLVGGRGELRTMRIAARFADEWNSWATADVFRQKSAVLDQHCERIGRDPAAIARSTQALLYLSTDESWLKRHRQRDSARPRLVGTPAEVTDQVGEYQQAGVDELIIPDWTLGPASRARDTLAAFWNEVAVHFSPSPAQG
jgi:F420-dependent oxidoreductase-like protein